MDRPQLSIRGAEGIEYPVFIGEGLLTRTLPQFIAERGFTRTAIITNNTLAPLYGEALAGRIPGAFLVTVQDGEQFKTPDTVRGIYSALLANSADRRTPVIALGGGVVGDMAGFAAATFMRGVPLIQCPTSLLAMVDASIGSKVGVDLPQGKNLVGAFYDPMAVFADTPALATLPAEEHRAGIAEVIKAGLVGDPDLFAMLEGGENLTDSAVIGRAVAVKAAVVEADRREAGRRAVLNLGHTFAHAIEQVSSYTWRHGYAVAAGMVYAARLSERLGLCAEGLAARIAEAVTRHDLPTRCEGYKPNELWQAMQVDKKWQAGKARFVLLRAVGDPVVVDDVRREDVLVVLAN